ncbi:MAG: hypothetical protein WC491_05875 [Candidatus Omnitrophota bacterium]
MKAKVKRLVVALALLVVLTGCWGDRRMVIDAGSVGYERDVMIIEAVENTRQMNRDAQ